MVYPGSAIFHLSIWLANTSTVAVEFLLLLSYCTPSLPEFALNSNHRSEHFTRAVPYVPCAVMETDNVGIRWWMIISICPGSVQRSWIYHVIFWYPFVASVVLGDIVCATIRKWRGFGKGHLLSSQWDVTRSAKPLRGIFSHLRVLLQLAHKIVMFRDARNFLYRTHYLK